MIKKLTLVIFLILFLTINIPANAFNERTTDFQLVYNESLISHDIYSIFVLPNEEININVYDPNNNHKYIIGNDSLKLLSNNNYGWEFKAPNEVGNYKLSITNQNLKQRIILNIFVLEPFSNMQGEYINGYRIGNYPIIPDKYKESYTLPKGFIKVTRENKDTFLTPHFKLSQFICKQQSNYPKYIVLKELLLNKLEYLLVQVNKKGFYADTFHIMSGYRTPYYNKMLGNVELSRHVFGDAADIYIDVNPRDGQMDDLNGDGRVTIKDANLLYNTVEESYNNREYQEYIGGLGLYRKTSSHSPFIHIDTRGYKARW